MSTAPTDTNYNTAHLIQNGDFAHVNTDRFADQGVKRNHFVFVAGLKPLPENLEDPYLQRIFVFIHKVTRDGHTKPDEGIFLMDPRDLTKVNPGRQKKFYNILKADFEQEIEAVENAMEEKENSTEH